VILVYRLILDWRKLPIEFLRAKQDCFLMRKMAEHRKISPDISSENTIDHATKLKILGRAQRRRLPRLLQSDDPEMLACAEMIDSGELDGCVILGSDGAPKKVLGACITELGREFLEQFETETVAPAGLVQRRQLIRGFGFATILISLLVAFPKTNRSGEKVIRTHVESISQPTDLQRELPKISPGPTDSDPKKLDATTVTVQIENPRFVHALCPRDHWFE
jgi:hypothetical protein